MELTCPKCHGTMRTYERNGVHVDQCAECRGIFLDRGELDRLIDAENAWHGGSRPAEKHDDDRRHESEHGRSTARSTGTRQDQYSSGGGWAPSSARCSSRWAARSTAATQQHSGHRPRKKESFLGDLFG